MNEHEMTKLIRSVIRQELTGMWMGFIDSNQSQTRSTIRRFTSEAPIKNVRNIQPFGLSSKIPKGVQVFTAPVNGDPTHINVLGAFVEGAFDSNPPTGLDGETILYNAFGRRIYLKQSTVHLASGDAASPLVLGNILKTMLSSLLTQISALAQEVSIHTHLAGAAPPPDDAANFVAIKAQVDALKASPVDDNGINSNIVFTD